MSDGKFTGGCLCGAVRFEVSGPLDAPEACHCTMCRRQTGHFYVGTSVPKTALAIQRDEGLAWYRSSDKVRRGFCRQCGSSLFFEPVYRDWIGIQMGSFDGPTGTRMKGHIFAANKGDYYDITDGLPQNAQ